MDLTTTTRAQMMLIYCIIKYPINYVDLLLPERGHSQYAVILCT
jgi:hypothetical protein